VDVVYGQEMCSSSLFRCYMVDVCSNDAQAAIVFWSTAYTLAAFFDRGEVCRVDSVPEVQYATICDGIAEALLMISIV
jgi:hypothetical protein